MPLCLLHWFSEDEEHISLLVGPLLNLNQNPTPETEQAVENLRKEARLCFWGFGHSMNDIAVFNFGDAQPFFDPPSGECLILDPLNNAFQHNPHAVGGFTWARARVHSAEHPDLVSRAHSSVFEFFDHRKDGIVPLHLLHWFDGIEEHISLLLGPLAGIMENIPREIHQAAEELRIEATHFFAQHDCSLNHFTVLQDAVLHDADAQSSENDTE